MLPVYYSNISFCLYLPFLCCLQLSLDFSHFYVPDLFNGIFLRSTSNWCITFLFSSYLQIFIFNFALFSITTPILYNFLINAFPPFFIFHSKLYFVLSLCYLHLSLFFCLLLAHPASMVFFTPLVLYPSALYGSFRQDILGAEMKGSIYWRLRGKKEFWAEFAIYLQDWKLLENYIKENVCVIENWKSRVDGFTSGYIDLIYWYVVEFNVLVSDIFESSVVCSRR